MVHDFPGLNPACSSITQFSTTGENLFRMSRSYSLYVWHNNDLFDVDRRPCLVVTHAMLRRWPYKSALYYFILLLSVGNSLLVSDPSLT